MKTGLLSLLIAIGVAFFSAYQFEEYQKFTASTQVALKRIETDSKTEIARLQAHFKETGEGEHWKVAEATYLIRLALEQWQVRGDANISLHLLAAADQQLQSLQDPRFIPVRERIKQDQLALQAVKLPDKEGLWLTVTALINKVSDLSTRGIRNSVPEREPREEGACETAQKSGDPSWKIALQRNLRTLKELVKIQHHSKPIEPILSESQQALARETLRLLLEQTRWSILHSNNIVYQTSIQQSIDWLNTYFEPGDEQVKQLKAALTELLAAPLQLELPEIGSALQLLQNAG